MPALLASRANTVAAENLAGVLAAESPLALVGAGLSVPAGMPSWSALLDEMEAQLPPLNEEYLKALRDEDDLLWRAEEYRRLIPEEAYQSMLRRRFGANVSMTPSNPAVALVKLPFRHFMTTNYDDVLLTAHDIAKRERPRVLNWSREDDVRSFIFGLRTRIPTRFLLHLHGHHSEPRSMVLTDNDYIDRYVRSFDTARKLFAILSTERVVFVGFSLSDPDLMALLREVNATMRSEDARHFAIVGLDRPASEILERNRLRKRYGVEPVFYDNTDRSHRGLLEVLRFLGERAAANPDAPALAAAVPQNIQVLERFNPDDPQKGLWGGVSKANGREVTATVRELEPDWFEATIVVKGQTPLLEGDVAFYLPWTIVPPVRYATAHNGVAAITVESYGAYTVGVEADGGNTQLELDLADIEGAPMVFRLN